jgi:hypothetical protein
VDGLPEEGFTPRLINTYCAKGAAIVVYQDKETQDWPGGDVPNLNAWGASRLKMLGLEVLLPTYKSGGLVSRPCRAQKALVSVAP